jgi:DNA-binding SARP family transcriptional activator
MTKLKVTLFGKCSIESEGEIINAIQPRKVQELFSYLLIFRDQPQSRELLSELFWADQTHAKSKKYLRQTLWRLQCSLKECGAMPGLEFFIEYDWIKISLSENVWLDVAEFEKIFDLVKEKRARELAEEEFNAVQYAVKLHKADFLEGWYQDWCIFERERFQTMQLTLLDKLVQYCEVHQMYDLGLVYGGEILRRDRAYERTHRQMMRLYYMAGDRTQALHQYGRCKAALRDDLDVEPSERTKQLYEQIRSDTFRPPLFALEKTAAGKPEATSAINNVLNQLEQFSKTLARIESQVQQEINTLENNLSGQT